MTALWLTMSALECADYFHAAYARGLWHGGGVVILVVAIVCVVVYFAKRMK